MNINATYRAKCECCSDEFINVPLDIDDLTPGQDDNPDLQLSLAEAKALIVKLCLLVNK